MNKVLGDISLPICTLRQRSQFATETTALLLPRAFGPTFIGAENDGAISALAYDAIKRCLQFVKELDNDTRLHAHQTGELSNTIERGVIHAELPNGSFSRHHPKRSERCLNEGNCTKANARCQRAKVCRRPSVKTMLHATELRKRVPKARMLSEDNMKQVYMITYPTKKIYIGKDAIGSYRYFGSPDMDIINADFAKLPQEVRNDYTIRKQILWESETATDAELSAKEVEMIRHYRSNDPTFGYNRWPKFKPDQG